MYLYTTETQAVGALFSTPSHSPSRGFTGSDCNLAAAYVAALTRHSRSNQQSRQSADAKIGNDMAVTSAWTIGWPAADVSGWPASQSRPSRSMDVAPLTFVVVPNRMCHAEQIVLSTQSSRMADSQKEWYLPFAQPDLTERRVGS